MADPAVGEEEQERRGGEEGSSSTNGDGTGESAGAVASTTDRSAKSWGWKELNGRRCVPSLSL